MTKLRWFGTKLGALAATAATFCSNTVATLLSQSSNTVATQIDTLHSRLPPSKTPISGSSSSNSSSTSPDFAQEKSNLREEIDNSPSDDVFPDSWESGDEYDEFDYDCWLDSSGDDDEWDWDYEPEGYLSEEDDDDWLSDDEDEDKEQFWPEDTVDRWDGADEKSWIEQAVDEAIDDEQPGQYPPGIPL